MLPPRFLLYIPARISKFDKFSGLALVDAVMDQEQGAYRLIVCDPSSDTYTVKYRPHDPVPVEDVLAGSMKTYSVKIFDANNDVVGKRLDNWSEQFKAKNALGEPIKVIAMSAHSKIFNTPVKRNVEIILDDSAVPSPAPTIPSPIVQQVPRRKNLLGRLNPFVAKQLMDLAIIRKDTCPITVEEFASGNTAVMPCGHLFTNLAIEESFKTVANQCPICRLPGAPVFT